MTEDTSSRMELKDRKLLLPANCPKKMDDVEDMRNWILSVTNSIRRKERKDSSTYYSIRDFIASKNRP